MAFKSCTNSSQVSGVFHFLARGRDIHVLISYTEQLCNPPQSEGALCF